jgi:hypothetical protein
MQARTVPTVESELFYFQLLNCSQWIDSAVRKEECISVSIEFC